MAKNDINIKINVDGKDASKSVVDFASGFKTVNKAIREARDQIKDYTFAINNVVAAFENLGRYSKSALDFLKDGASYTEAKESFDAYTKSLGANSNAIVSSLRKASAGTISNRNLVLTASRAMALGVTSDSEKMGKLLEIARNRATLFGVDTTKAFDDIVTGIGRGSPMILDNLGIRIPAGFAQMTQGMTEAQKVSKLLELVLADGERELESLGGLTLSTADKFRQLESAVDDLSVELKADLSESLVSLVDFARKTGIPAMKSGLDLVNDFVKSIKKLDDEFSAINLTLSATAGAFSGLALATVLSQITEIAKQIGKANAAQKLFNASALLNPYVAIGALAGVSAYAFKIKWDEWSANDLEQANIQAILNSNNPKRVAEVKIEQLMEKLDKLHKEYGSEPDLERKREAAKLKLDKAASAYDAYMANPNAGGYGLGSVQVPKDSAQKELDLIEQKIEAIKKVNEVLLYEMDTLKVVEQQQKALFESKKKAAEKDEESLATISETVVAYDSLADSIRRAYSASRNYEGTVEGLAKGLETVYASAVSLLDNTGFGKNSFISTSLEDIARAAAEAVNSFEDLSPHLEQFKDFGKSAEKAFSYLQSGLETYIKHATPKTEEFSLSKWFGFDVIEKVYNSAGTTKAIEKTADTIHNEFRDAIASSVSDGFARADFSGFADSLRAGLKGIVGGALSDTIHSLFKQQNMGSLVNGTGLFKQVYTENATGDKNSLNWSALAGNVGIGLGLSFLTSDGGLLGRRKIVGAENISKSAELNAQVDQAKALRDQLFLGLGIADYTRQLLDEAQFAYTYVTSSKSKNILKRKTTYSLHNQEAAQSSINYLETLQAQALGEQAQRNYTIYNLGRNDAISAAAAHVADAQSAYNAAQALLYGGKSQSALQADIDAKVDEWGAARANSIWYYARVAETNNAVSKAKYARSAEMFVNQARAIDEEIRKLKYELDNPTYKYSLAERTQMQQQLKEAEVALINTKQDARTSLSGSFLGSSTLASLVPNSREIIMSNYSTEELKAMRVKTSRFGMGKRRDWAPLDVMGMLMGDIDVGSNTEMIRAMLPLLKEAGLKDFDLTKAFNAAQNDPQKLLDVYKQQQGILQSASSVYEQLYKDAESESLNSKLADEERMAAFERWQDSFYTFIEIQEQILANTQTIADIEKQNFSKSMANDLSDALTVFAEAMNQTNKTEIYYQSLSAQEILAKLKAALKESNPVNADSLIFAINELEELDLWG